MPLHEKNQRVYVGNNLMVGNPEAIGDAIKHLRKEKQVFKVIDGLNDYLSCQVSFLENKKQSWIEQPYLQGQIMMTMMKIYNYYYIVIQRVNVRKKIF